MAGIDDGGSWLEIDEAAFRSNVRELQEMIAGQSRLCAVMKSDAYGHGLGLLMPSLNSLGVSAIGIGSNFEAATARAHGFTGTLIRVRAAAPQEIKSGLHLDIEELVADQLSANQAQQIAADAGRVLRIHLDINSGGIGRHSLDVSAESGRREALDILALPALALAGIMTHFPVEDADDVRAGVGRFQSEAAWVLEASGLDREQVLFHCANSYAALKVPESWMDMVRAGATLFGDSTKHHRHFRKCFTFKARLGSVNSYPAGTSIGYERGYTLPRAARLATVTAGYGDGYRRALAAEASVLVRGRRARVVDRLSMNSMVVDVTSIPHATPGDEVVLFGVQGREEISQGSMERSNGNILADLYTVWGASNYRTLVRPPAAGNR